MSSKSGVSRSLAMRLDAIHGSYCGWSRRALCTWFSMRQWDTYLRFRYGGSFELETRSLDSMSGFTSFVFRSICFSSESRRS